MSPRGGGFLDAAHQILKETGRPMHGIEIVRVGRERGLFTSNAKDDGALVRTITSHVKRSGNSRGFTVLRNGYYGLAEWPDAPPSPTTPERRRRSAQAWSVSDARVPEGITLDKLERLRQIMSEPEFREDWGPLYDQLLAQERAQAITSVSDRLLVDRIRRVVQRIQDFLQGRGNESPKSEVVCDWIFICYTLELLREGAALWRYVNKDEISAWQCERTAKFSTACRARVGP